MRDGRGRLGAGDARGQVTILLGLLVVTIAAGAMILLGAMGGTVQDRQRARTAADAAALAGVLGGQAAARDVAVANGGALEGFTTSGGQAEATVRVGRARASARAEPWPGGRSGNRSPDRSPEGSDRVPSGAVPASAGSQGSSP